MVSDIGEPVGDDWHRRAHARKDSGTGAGAGGWACHALIMFLGDAGGARTTTTTKEIPVASS